MVVLGSPSGPGHAARRAAAADGELRQAHRGGRRFLADRARCV